MEKDKCSRKCLYLQITNRNTIGIFLILKYFFKLNASTKYYSLKHAYYAVVAILQLFLFIDCILF